MKTDERDRVGTWRIYNRIEKAKNRTHMHSVYKTIENSEWRIKNCGRVVLRLFRSELFLLHLVLLLFWSSSGRDFFFPRSKVFVFIFAFLLFSSSSFESFSLLDKKYFFLLDIIFFSMHECFCIVFFLDCRRIYFFYAKRTFLLKEKRVMVESKIKSMNFFNRIYRHMHVGAEYSVCFWDIYI